MVKFLCLQKLIDNYIIYRHKVGKFVVSWKDKTGTPNRYWYYSEAIINQPHLRGTIYV